MQHAVKGGRVQLAFCPLAPAPGIAPAFAVTWDSIACVRTPGTNTSDLSNLSSSVSVVEGCGWRDEYVQHAVERGRVQLAFCPLAPARSIAPAFGVTWDSIPYVRTPGTNISNLSNLFSPCWWRDQYAQHAVKRGRVQLAYCLLAPALSIAPAFAVTWDSIPYVQTPGTNISNLSNLFSSVLVVEG